MSGSYYGHALIIGTGYTSVLVDSDGPIRVVLAEKCWGAGRVMVGGMTTDNWHSPAPNASNFRANLYVYLYENACGGGCTYTQDVTVYAAPTVNLTISDTEICEGESVVITGTGADTYTFDVPGIVSGASYTPPSDGTFNYTVTGTDAVSGCTSEATVSLTVHPTPVVTASSDDLEVCFGDAMTLTGGGAETYSWDHGAIDGVPFTPGPIGTTVYTVTGTSEFGCTATASISIDIIDCEPVDADFFFDNNICVGDCITLTDSSIGTTIVSYEWDFDGAVDPTTSTLQNPTVCFNTVGIYNISLTITSLYGQVSTETKTLTVNALPIISTQLDTIIELGGEANLIATCPSDGAYSWSPTQYVDCPDCGITTTSPEDSTMYTVTFIDENGCKDQDQVMVLVNFIKGVGLPTAFTPNGDGANDILFIKGVGLAAVSLVIYNRYGEVVFQTTDQNIGWDGTFKGREENPGVFTWVLQYDFITGDRGMQKGNTTLIR
jgi:gliding motility-associated-like protein